MTEILGMTVQNKKIFILLASGKTLSGLCQQGHPLLLQPVILYGIGRFMKSPMQLLLRNQPFLIQLLQVYKIRIQGKGAVGAVGGSPLIRQTKGQCLPIGKAALL